jgi:hypothetical protein
MARIIRSEWHQLERRYSVEVDRRLLKQVYPMYNENQINEMYVSIMSGNTDVKEIMDDAEGLDIVWAYDGDDLWTDRKGGYDTTYELSVED